MNGNPARGCLTNMWKKVLQLSYPKHRTPDRPHQPDARARRIAIHPRLRVLKLRSFLPPLPRNIDVKQATIKKCPERQCFGGEGRGEGRSRGSPGRDERERKKGTQLFFHARRFSRNSELRCVKKELRPLFSSYVRSARAAVAGRVAPYPLPQIARDK